MTVQSGQTSLSTDQVLDELAAMVGVEHALIVEYLTLSCALGHDLPAAEGGPSTETASEVAQRFNALADGAMLRIRQIADALDGRRTILMVDRAHDILGPDGTTISLDPPTAEQLEHFLDREQAIAGAVDARYARIAQAAAAAEPGGLSEEVRTAITDGSGHVDDITALRDQIGAQPEADLLRATRRFSTKSHEQSLVRAHDRTYRLMLELLQQHLGDLDGDQSGEFRMLALSAMDVLDNISRPLIHAGLIPTFPRS